MENTLVAVDLAKSIFEIAVSTRPGRIAARHRLSRERFLAFFAQLPASVTVMEACGSAHYWARRIEGLGHRVVLLPPHQARPYVLRNKTDRTDVKGLLEAYRNEDVRPVPIKSVEQQILSSLHRLRSGWVAERTARINTLRGLLRELGLTIPVGAHHVVPRVWGFLEDADSGVPDALRPFFAEACEEIRAIEARVSQVERQLQALAQQLPATEKLRSIPGIGLLTATALVGFVGHIQRFPSARHFASYLGLTPRERSSGGKRHLGRISKRGDAYLRTLLVHGARSVLTAAARKEHNDRLRVWALKLRHAHGYRKAAVALANKLARIAWAVWGSDRAFQSAEPVAA